LAIHHAKACQNARVDKHALIFQGKLHKSTSKLHHIFQVHILYILYVLHITLYFLVESMH